MIIHDWKQKRDILIIDGDEITTTYTGKQVFVMDPINASTCARFENALRYEDIDQMYSYDVVYATDKDGNSLMLNYGKNPNRGGMWVDIVINKEGHRHTSIYFVEGSLTPYMSSSEDELEKEIEDYNYRMKYPFDMEDIEESLGVSVPTRSIPNIIRSFWKRR